MQKWESNESKVSTAVAPNSERLGDDKANYEYIRGSRGSRISAL